MRPYDCRESEDDFGQGKADREGLPMSTEEWWRDGEFCAAVRAFHRRAVLRMLRYVGVCLAVTALAALTAWAVGAFQ
jgi:hypothetical protein